jgi:hypothetical protein
MERKEIYEVPENRIVYNINGKLFKKVFCNIKTKTGYLFGFKYIPLKQINNEKFKT